MVTYHKCAIVNVRRILETKTQESKDEMQDKALN